jgi:hypothetical protein
LGTEALQREERERNDLEFKKELGRIVEETLQKELNDVLGENQLKALVENEQGGQDLILRLNDVPIYYIEVKSRWSSDKSVLMSTLQHRTSFSEKQHYALCAADMTAFKDQVSNHEYPVFEQMEQNLSFITTIGELNSPLISATLDDDTKVHIASGYQVLVSQRVIQENGIPFRAFIDRLKEHIKASLVL